MKKTNLHTFFMIWIAVYTDIPIANQFRGYYEVSR